MTPWYRSRYWFLLIVVVLIGWWVRSNWPASAPKQQQATNPAAQQSAAPAAEATPTVKTIGGNLLTNPTFASNGNGWTAYHNAEPMPVTFSSSNGGEAAISINNVTSSVQEIFQFLPTGLRSPLFISGNIVISGAPMPPDAAVNAFMIDTDGKPHTLYQVGATNGTGTFPFWVSYTPHGAAKQLVIAVIVASQTDKITTVSVRNLSIRRLAPK
jgi:hypothetical protein